VDFELPDVFVNARMTAATRSAIRVVCTVERHHEHASAYRSLQDAGSLDPMLGILARVAAKKLTALSSPDGRSQQGRPDSRGSTFASTALDDCPRHPQGRAAYRLPRVRMLDGNPSCFAVSAFESAQLSLEE
jgi:hypothetical protein